MLERLELLRKLAKVNATLEQLTAELSECESLHVAIETWIEAGRRLDDQLRDWVNRQLAVTEENDRTIEVLRQQVNDADPSEAWKNA